MPSTLPLKPPEGTLWSDPYSGAECCEHAIATVGGLPSAELLPEPAAASQHQQFLRLLSPGAAGVWLGLAGLDEPGFVGGDDCLHAVAQAEFGQDAGDV